MSDAVYQIRTGFSSWLDTDQATFEAFNGPDENRRVLSTASQASEAEQIAETIHWPEHWDTAAYPDVWSALQEVMHSFQCSECRLEPQAECAPREAQPNWKALHAAADAVAASADIWAGFSTQDAKVCVDAYLAAPTPERADADTAGALSTEQERRFEAWAVSEGLIRESHGVLSVNAVCDVAKKAWLAALSAPASQERADAGKDATLTRWQKAQMAFGGGTTPEPPVGVASLARALTWALEWIDAVPEDTPLPAMPGFDRDYVNELLARVRATAALDAATAQTTTKENGR